MHSARHASPTGQATGTTRKSARRPLGFAFAVFLMSIAGATWAPTAARVAGDLDKSGNATAPVASQSAKLPVSAPVPDLPAAEGKSTRQPSVVDKEVRKNNKVRDGRARSAVPNIAGAADKVTSSSGSVANASTLNPSNRPSPNFKGLSNAAVVAGQTFLSRATNGKAGPNRQVQTASSSVRVVANESSAPPTVSSAGYRSPGEQHKILVSDRQLADTLVSQGGKVISDYGSFVLLEANDAVANSLAKNHHAQIVDENNLVLLNAGTIDTSTPAAQSRRAASKATFGKQMRLIQFAGPIRPEWYQALVATGVRIVTYIPNNAYLVYGDSQTLQAVQQLATDRSIAPWDGEYAAAFRVDPAITASGNARVSAKDGAAGGKDDKVPAQQNLSARGNEQFTIQMVEDEEENAITLALIEQFKLEPIVKQDRMLGYLNVTVALPKDAVLDQLAKRGDVVSIQQWITPRKLGERESLISAGLVSGSPAVPNSTDYLAFLTSKGISVNTPSTFAINLSDSGIDNATTTPNHFALYAGGDPSVPANSRIIYNRLIGTPHGGSTLQGCDGHGNLNSHILGGYVPTGTVGGTDFGAFPHADFFGYRYGLGIAPFVKIGSTVIFDPDLFTSPVFQNVESQAYNDGARISNNSWGFNSNAYTVESQQFDALVRDAQPDTGCSLPNCVSAVGNQEQVIVFPVGTQGAGSNTVGAPSTAKNVISVGAAENVQSIGGADGCGVLDTQADDANDIIGFSSRGPTADGRRKPDILAPGTHVTAGVAQASIASPTGSGTGAQLACYDATGVCGGPGASAFFPFLQQWYTLSSGTSHAAPVISGAAAVIRQHFINQALTPPSPAMTKALMLNSARYLDGAGANDTLPSNNQGMGEINLSGYFDVIATAHSLHDQLPAETFTASGQQRVITGSVSDISKPLRVTLAWTDAPGPTTGNAFVNNLDLEVTVGGNTYKGNVFSGAFSATGGIADTRNNVESVFIPAGVSGTLIIKVKATNIAGDGVPNNAQPLDQDFALVAYNVTEAPFPVISGGTTTVTAESCSLANNAIDPAETVTVNFALSNIGTANTANLVATLQATGGVTSPSGPQNYGVVTANGSAIVRPFTFTAGTTCGQTLTATFQLQDGATNLGTATFTLLTGALGAPILANYSTGNIATPIPDNSTVDIPINISDTGLITDVNVRVRLNHTFDNDLTLSLVAPDNTIVTLSQNRDSVSGGGDNYGTGPNNCSGTPTIFDDAAGTAISGGVPPFAGTFRPENPLSALNGMAITGTWKLRVNDNALLDTGTIGCVTLEITRQRFICCGVPGTPQIVSGGAPTLTAENATPANNTPDPGETVTVNFPLINTGDGNTANLVATLLNSGGVTPVTTTQNYGVVLAPGPAVSRPFTFVTNGACGGIITVTLHLQDGALDLGNVTYQLTLGTTVDNSLTFSNTTAITIPATGTGAVTGAPATPYPSNITVAGAPTTISKVTVKLKGINHGFPSDVDVLLVSPAGKKFILMSDVIGGTDWTGQDYTFDDAAAAILPSSGTPPASGTFQPTNYGTPDAFPAPAPGAPYLTPATTGTDTLTSAFTADNPNGTWSLYVVDDAGTDIGNFSGGWEITLTTTTNVCSGPPPLAVVAANSRRVHGAAGTFDLPLSLVSANPTTEPRLGPAQTVVLTFNEAIIGATVTITEGIATTGSPTLSGNFVTVDLTGVADQQYVTISLTNISDATGGTGGSASVRLGFLAGDVNQDRSVTVADLSLINAQLAQPVTAANFINDVNASGTLTVADKGFTNANLAATLPPP